jgi:prolyl-tRNA synthetase
MDKFSKPFNLTYKDRNGKEKYVFMGCYGIGLTRLLGAIVEVSHDKNGIIWPESVAPFKAHLLELATNNRRLATFTNKVYNSLQKAGVEVLYDNRKDATIGEKFNDADLIGIPHRLVISEKTGNKIEVKKRNEKRTRLASEKELVKILQ